MVIDNLEDENLEIDFWKEWLEAEMFERQELVKSLPLFRMCSDVEESGCDESLAILINSYCEYLKFAIYIKRSISFVEPFPFKLLLVPFSIQPVP